MKRPLHVAIAGATGAVGVEMVKTLESRNFPVASLKLLASARSAGKKVKFRGEDVTVEELGEKSFEGVDVALFSAGAGVSKQYREAVVRSGAVMIDNSSAFRMEDGVPLVVPEVNPEDAKNHHGVIANPNCTTIIMLVAVAPLHRAFGLKRLVASTYQSASGAGAKGMNELLSQTKALLAAANGMDELAERYRDVLSRVDPPSAFADPIAFNVFPHIDVFGPNGYSKEEMKMVNETRKILHEPAMRVTCTSVRVPALRAHSESLNLEFSRKVTPEEVRKVLADAPDVILRDDPAAGVYPMPVDASGHGEVLVGRIRSDLSNPDGTGIEMFVSGDQLLKGAAFNAVQIAELL
ncbi:MAG: aspartate-semialdehyde dehydrogenase [Kiritimatiellae bacterium]|nr:aspartate-semialdehyde dehydrogenase [Kiritimatiellia bacterium]MBR1837569.1 aspartate-semialdehyde dehydrogenase [Kiritimatiellia bacterium]